MRRALAALFGFLAATAATQATAEPRAVDPIEAAFWQAVTADRECATVQAYLMRFPNGAYADLAAMEERRRCANAATPVAPAPPTPSVMLLPDPATSVPDPAQAPALTMAPAIATPSDPPPEETGPAANRPTDRARRGAHAQERPEHGRSGRQHASYMDEPIDVGPRGPVGPYGFGMRRGGFGMATAPPLVINRPGESYMYVGNMRCRTLGGGRAQIICP